jgi:hypothetical protein
MPDKSRNQWCGCCIADASLVLTWWLHLGYINSFLYKKSVRTNLKIYKGEEILHRSYGFIKGTQAQRMEGMVERSFGGEPTSVNMYKQIFDRPGDAHLLPTLTSYICCSCLCPTACRPTPIIRKSGTSKIT